MKHFGDEKMIIDNQWIKTSGHVGRAVVKTNDAHVLYINSPLHNAGDKPYASFEVKQVIDSSETIDAHYAIWLGVFYVLERKTCCSYAVDQLLHQFLFKGSTRIETRQAFNQYVDFHTKQFLTDFS